MHETHYKAFLSLSSVRFKKFIVHMFTEHLICPSLLVEMKDIVPPPTEFILYLFFTCSLNRHFLSTYYVPGTVSFRDTEKNNT